MKFLNILCILFLSLFVSCFTFESKINDSDAMDNAFFLENKFDKSPAKHVASLVKNSIEHVTPDEFKTILEYQYKKLYLMDEGGNWAHENLENISNNLLPYLDSNIANAFIDQVVVHVEENPLLMRFLEAAVEKDFKVLKQRYLTQRKEVLPRVVAYGVALESLTKAQIDDPAVLQACFDVWKAKRKEKISLWDEDVNPFSLGKLTTIEGPIKSILSFYESGKVDPKFFVGLLPINVYEAMMTDFANGYHDNGKAARPLMVNRPMYNPNEALGTGPAEWSEDRKIVLVKTPLTKDWNDLYQTWNMAFCSQFGNFPFYFDKLLVPVVNNYSEQPDAFWHKRVLALFTHLHHYFLGNVYDREHGIPFVEWKDKELSKFWGKMNRQFADEYSKMVKEAK